MLQMLHYYTTSVLRPFIPEQPGNANTNKAAPFGILMKQEMMGGSGISWTIWTICTSLQTDNHASTSSLSFYRPDALPAAQPTA